MARISSYPQDSLVEGTDKLIGTDEDGEVTKTFTLTSIGEWLKYNTQPIATLTSADGTQFIVAAANDGSIQGIPLDSVAPDITTLPTISGTLNVGETLTAVAGTATGIPTPTRVLQWQRSDNGTTGWVDIAGATGTSYLLAFNDEDKYIRVAQTEENILGTATANSVSTTQIGPLLFDFLFDDYSGAPLALSLRRLNRNYQGDAIIVRRTSDNTTQSIGFVSNELDIFSLESFCAGTDGRVVTWYDQSGNNFDFTQTTASEQPIIVQNGQTVLQNGKPTILFQRLNSQWLLNQDLISLTSDYWIFYVRNLFTYDQSYVFDSEVGRFLLERTGANAYFYNGAWVGSGLNSGNFLVHYDLDSSSQLNISNVYENGSIVQTNLPYSPQSISQNTGIGGRYFSGQNTNMSMQEFIIYNTNQRANRTRIETNINDFYTIY